MYFKQDLAALIESHDLKIGQGIKEQKMHNGHTIFKRKKEYLIKEKFIYYSIILASVANNIYISINNFNLRILSILFIITFYVFLALFFAERKSYSLNNIQRGNRKIIFIYIVIVQALLIFSIRFNSKDLASLFFHPLSFLAYFIAIIVLIVNENTIIVLKKISTTVNNIVPLFLFVDYYIFNKGAFIEELHSFILFEILFIDKLKWNRKVYILLLLITTIFVENQFDNRTIVIRLLVTSFSIALFYYFDFLNNKIIKYILLSFNLIFLYFITYQFENTFKYLTDIITISSVNTIDTRTFLFYEFFQDFKGTDWIIGRGYLGTYYSDWFYNWKGDKGDSYNRFSLEVGLLQILLKGGILMLFTFLFILLKALKKGFIDNSFNTISFRFAIYLFLQLVLMSIENRPTFNVNYMFVWISIGIIFNSINSYSKKNFREKLN